MPRVDPRLPVWGWEGWCGTWMVGPVCALPPAPTALPWELCILCHYCIHKGLGTEARIPGHIFVGGWDGVTSVRQGGVLNQTAKE